MEKPLVSIIVPVYNTEFYLERCIQSLLQQTYKNIEILLIDDGSTDGSAYLCDRFAEQYANIHVVHMENGGVSAARNKGLDIAQGEFVLFIDSDDTISNTYVNLFINVSNDADIIIGAIEEIYVDEKSLVYKKQIRDHQAFQQGYLFNEYYNLLELLRGPWIKLYRKSIIDTYHLRFDERLSVAEDQAFNFSYYRYIESYLVEPKCVYKYYHYKGSHSLASTVTEKTFEDEVFKLNLEYVFLKEYNVTNYNIVYIHQLLGVMNKYINLQDNHSIQSSYKRIKRLAKLNPLIVDMHLNFRKKIILYLLQYKMYWLVTIYYRFKSIC